MFTYQDKSFFRDRLFFSQVLTLAVPMIIQNLISSSLNLVDGVIIGHLGDTAIAAAGLANQVYFLLTLMLFGVSSGASIFAAQYWGKGDLPAIRKVQGVCLAMGISGAGLFSLIALFAPRFVLGILTADPLVIDQGSQYLQIVGFGYVFFAVTFAYSSILRSTGNVKVPMFISIIALAAKTGLSYLLMFGGLGIPALGLIGAAFGTLFARVFELSLMLYIVYSKKLPPAARFKEMFSFNWPFVQTILKTALPVAINETMWSFGIVAYNTVYAHIGTTSIAAVNICSTIENLAFVIFIGISDACAIIVGNSIGAGEEKKAIVYSRRLLVLTVAGALLMGGIIFASRDLMLSLYNVSSEVLINAHNILTIMAFTLWLRVSNMTVIVGIMRSGGDTRFALWLDAGTVWGVGVPLALLGAFVFQLPVHLVYLMVMSDEILKFFIALWRFFSLKWLNNLAHTAA